MNISKIIFAYPDVPFLSNSILSNSVAKEHITTYRTKRYLAQKDNVFYYLTNKEILQNLDSGLGESGSDNVSMRMLLTKVVFVLTEEGTHTLYSRRTAIVMVKVGTQEEY